MAMKRKLRLFLANVAAVAALTSCASARYYAGFTPENAVNEMALLEPVATQFYSDKNGNEFYSDSLTVRSQYLMETIATQIGVPVNCVIPLDSLQREEVNGFINYVAAHDKRAAGDIPIPQALDELLEQQGYRYGLVLFANGIARDKAKFAKDAALGLTLGILTAVITLGMVSFYTIPIEGVSVMYAAVLDSWTDRIVFYNISETETFEPASERVVYRQLSRLLKDYLPK